MRIVHFCSLILCFTSAIHAQVGTDTTRNIIYFGGGRQGLSYAKYERLVYYRNWTQAVVNAGYGGIPVAPKNGDARTNKLMIECAQLFGFKQFFLELGVEPSVNFYGYTTYLDLNGIIGLRYQSRTHQLKGLFFQTGYNPHLYSSHDDRVNLPFYFGLGINF